MPVAQKLVDFSIKLMLELKYFRLEVDFRVNFFLAYFTIAKIRFDVWHEFRLLKVILVISWLLINRISIQVQVLPVD